MAMLSAHVFGEPFVKIRGADEEQCVFIGTAGDACSGFILSGRRGEAAASARALAAELIAAAETIEQSIGPFAVTLASETEYA